MSPYNVQSNLNHHIGSLYNERTMLSTSLSPNFQILCEVVSHKQGTFCTNAKQQNSLEFGKENCISNKFITMLGTFNVILLDSTLEHNKNDSCVWYTIYKNCVNNTKLW
jgi:hypothetical protein